MTPEGKAKELVENFLSYTSDGGRKRFYSKLCALICCDEIINAFERYDNDINRYEPCRPLESYEYWKKVRTEIEKL